MLAEPNCFTRRCKHFLGIKWFGDEESTENNFCTAFPEGIPSEIAYGKNDHSTKHPDQVGDYLYKKQN